MVVGSASPAGARRWRRQRRARVLVLERAAVHGGTSSMSGGHFYLGGGTAVQQATGWEDSPEEMYKYLVAVSKEPEHDKIRAYCDGSVEHFDWLESLGFEFERSFYPEKAVIQPGTQGLMFTGNEKVWPFKEQAVPTPRGHKVPVPGDTEGTRLVLDLLRDRPRGGRGRGRYETAATHLVTDDAGAVVGLAWRRFEETGVVAAGGVVLAAGGFVMNRTWSPSTRRHSARSCSPSGRRTTTAWASAWAGRSGPTSLHDRAVHHRAVLPAVDPDDRRHRQRGRPALVAGTATTRGPRSS